MEAEQVGMGCMLAVEAVSERVVVEGPGEFAAVERQRSAQ